MGCALIMYYQVRPCRTWSMNYFPFSKRKKPSNNNFNYNYIRTSPLSIPSPCISFSLDALSKHQWSTSCLAQSYVRTPQKCSHILSVKAFFGTMFNGHVRVPEHSAESAQQSGNYYSFSAATLSDSYKSPLPSGVQSQWPFSSTPKKSHFFP
jgi:hypothetical protein